MKRIIKTPPKPERKVKNRSRIPLSRFSTQQPSADSQAVGQPKKLLGGPNCTKDLQTAQNQKRIIKCSQNMLLVPPLADVTCLHIHQKPQQTHLSLHLNKFLIQLYDPRVALPDKAGKAKRTNYQDEF